MMKWLGMVLVIAGFTATQVDAQGCNCIEGPMVEAIEMRMAERQQKLEFVLGGQTESRTGLSNDPAVLRAEIRDITRVRDQLLGEWAMCRRGCGLNRSLPAHEPDSAETMATADCADCERQDLSLDDLEAQLALNLWNMRAFRLAHGLENQPGIMASSFDGRSDRLSQARAAFESVETTMSELIARRERRCHGFDLSQIDHSEFELEWREALQQEQDFAWPGHEALPPDPRQIGSNNFYMNNDPDLDPNRRLENANGREVYFEYRDALGDVHELPPARVREIFATTLRIQVDYPDMTVDEIRNTIVYGDDFSEYLRAEENEAEYSARAAFSRSDIIDPFPTIGAMLGNAGTEFMEALRMSGMALPDDWSTSDFGDCLAAARIADRYFRDEFQPAQNDVFEAAAQLPADGDDAVMNQFRQLELQIHSLRRRRDNALETLIDCNIRQCRPRPQSQLDLREDNVLNQYEAETENAVSDEVYGDEDDGLDGDGPTLPGDAESGTAELPEMETGMDYRVALEEVERQIEAMGISAEPDGEVCRADPADVCSRLDGEDSEALCLARFSVYGGYCRRADDAPDGSLDQCYARCDAQGERARFSHWLHTEVTAIVALNAQGTEAGQAAVLQNELNAATTELAEIEAAIASRRIHIYTNTDTNETVQHDGPYFDPEPPLEYNGEIAAPPTESQAERRALLSGRIDDLTARIVEIETTGSRHADWLERVNAIWNGSARAQSPVAGCAPEEVDDLQAQCRDACDFQAQYYTIIQYEEFCRPMSMIGLMDQSDSHSWIYPPD